MSLPEHQLVKAVWTEADLEDMGWHDATVWAYMLQKADNDSVLDGEARPTDLLCLDLDYITRWVEPDGRRRPFTFWVAPATLVFLNVTEFRAAHATAPLHAQDDCEISDLRRTPEGWHVEGHSFDLHFQADGFRQVFRAAPRHGRGPRLSLEERGGYSFSQQAADL